MYIFGKGHSWSNFVLGLEPMNGLLALNRQLAMQGVVSTPLSRREPPPPASSSDALTDGRLPHRIPDAPPRCPEARRLRLCAGSRRTAQKLWAPVWAPSKAPSGSGTLHAPPGRPPRSGKPPG